MDIITGGEDVKSNAKGLIQNATEYISKLKQYWKNPPKGKYMPFREIAAYAGGGIGVYFLFTIGTACILGTGNTLISSTLGVDATDMYILYVLAVIANIPLTGIRASIIDNTRNKGGKYRPYIVTMGIPTAIVCIAMVWFPYDKLGMLVGEGMWFGESRAYVAKCAVILVLNFILHFCYYFFYDGYENLIHVLSPDTQERADVSAIKSVVYSLSPSITNLITPIIAQHIFHTNTTDIRVYRLLYPILGILGIIFCIIVYKGTQEKIVQAKTHVVQIRFMDALREVSKNKYFWIISLAGWIGFLETAYLNVLFWLYNYGGACSGDQYGLIITIYGNASLWGMILAPFCIRRWGKKGVLVVTNLFNVACILLMLPATSQIQNSTIWMVLGCLYFNAFMGSFAHILNPSIQADIRDYQQYRSGERIDGMFSAVATVGTVITLATSSVLPVIYEKNGLTKANAVNVTANERVLSRMLGDGKTVGQILAEQMANGQDNYSNSYSALYDPDILLKLIHVLIIVSAIGALMNVIPYFWYDFNERKQKSVVKVLKVRAMFEDYNNGVISDENLVEGVEIIRTANDNTNSVPVDVSKKSYKEKLKQCKSKEEKKACKKARREAMEFNENIEIDAFVREELSKFSTPLYIHQLEVYSKVYEAGLEGLRRENLNEVNAELKAAKAKPKTTSEEKDIRRFAIEIARMKKASCKIIKKNYPESVPFVEPGMEKLESYFDAEDNANEEIKELYNRRRNARKTGESVRDINAAIKAATVRRDQAKKDGKAEMDRIADFNRAAKPYLDAEKLLKCRENYAKLDEVFALYDDAKARVEALAPAE